MRHITQFLCCGTEDVVAAFSCALWGGIAEAISIEKAGNMPELKILEKTNCQISSDLELLLER
jgi:hypothetical protein